MINWKVIMCSFLYVLATLLLRQSIDSGLTNVNIQIIFSLTIGLLGLILYVYQRPTLDIKSIY